MELRVTGGVEDGGMLGSVYLVYFLFKALSKLRIKAWVKGKLIVEHFFVFNQGSR